MASLFHAPSLFGTISSAYQCYKLSKLYLRYCLQKMAKSQCLFIQQMCAEVSLCSKHLLDVGDRRMVLKKKTPPHTLLYKIEM